MRRSRCILSRHDSRGQHGASHRLLYSVQDWPDAVHAGEPVHAEVADTLRVAAMVQEFRRNGHLVARLDPLRRPARGPWLAEVPTHGSDQRWVFEWCLSELVR